MFTQQGRFPVLSVPLPGLALFVWSSTALHGVRYGDKVWINRKRPARRPESHGIILPSLVIFPCTCIFYGTFPSFCHCNRQWRTITSLFTLTLLSVFYGSLFPTQDKNIIATFLSHNSDFFLTTVSSKLITASYKLVFLTIRVLQFAFAILTCFLR